VKKKLFYNNWIFRIAAPPLFGVIIYLLVLLFFGSAGMLFENFFSREVLFVIILTYLFFELNRLVIVVLNRIIPFTPRIRLRITLQYILAFIVSISLISSVLSAYFIYIEGFNTITTELFTFNSIYLLTAIFYHLYFVSIMFLHIRNDAKVKEELTRKENLKLELQAFKNQVNPGFLFSSLEIILSELYRNKKNADHLVDQLAKTYRYRLDNRKLEMVPLALEKENLEPVTRLYTARYGKGLTVEFSDPGPASVQTIPGTLQILLEHAVNNSIITESLPLHLHIERKENRLMIVYPDHPTIQLLSENGERLTSLGNALKYYTGRNIREWIENDCRHFEIPLVIIDEE